MRELLKEMLGYLPFFNRDNLKLSKILNLGLCVGKVFEFTPKLVRIK